MADDTSRLSKLGSEKTEYTYEGPSAGMFETFDNPAPGTMNLIRHQFSEFTSLCPKTGQPDFATVEIDYIADERCVETKSLKLYFFAYRNHGSFMESIANKMLLDLVEAMQPKTIRVNLDFAARGGIATSVCATYTQAVGTMPEKHTFAGTPPDISQSVDRGPGSDVSQLRTKLVEFMGQHRILPASTIERLYQHIETVGGPSIQQLERFRTGPLSRPVGELLDSLQRASEVHGYANLPSMS